MSLITKEHLSLVLQSVKMLLSRKADKSELVLKADKSELATKVDRSEMPDEFDALEIVAEMELIEPPVVADDGSIYTDENGDIYTL
jgi:hypothetical protein